MKIIKQICLKDFFEKYFCFICGNFFQKNLLLTTYCSCGCEESIRHCETCAGSNCVQIEEFCGC